MQPKEEQQSIIPSFTSSSLCSLLRMAWSSSSSPSALILATLEPYNSVTRNDVKRLIRWIRVSDRDIQLQADLEQFKRKKNSPKVDYRALFAYFSTSISHVWCRDDLEHLDSTYKPCVYDKANVPYPYVWLNFESQHGMCSVVDHSASIMANLNIVIDRNSSVGSMSPIETDVTFKRGLPKVMLTFSIKFMSDGSSKVSFIPGTANVPPFAVLITEGHKLRFVGLKCAMTGRSFPVVLHLDE